ncbi:hypothetical protein ACJX0J_007404, partial [Zea mays]
VAALGLGTYDAHMFCPKNPAYKEVWHTSSLYHLIHTAALLGAPITKRPNVREEEDVGGDGSEVVAQGHRRLRGGLLTTGIVLFSGT